MLDKIIGNDKPKFMTNYSKLSNELNYFITNKGKPNGGILKIDSTSSKNTMNLFVNEKFSNLGKKDKENSYVLVTNDKKNVYEKNIFGNDLIKKEKWQEIKNAINLSNHPHNKVTSGSNSTFDRIKNNLNNMRKQFTLEEALQKNLDNLNGMNIISPRNDLVNNTTNKLSYSNLLIKSTEESSNSKGLKFNNDHFFNEKSNNFRELNPKLKNNLNQYSITQSKENIVECAGNNLNNYLKKKILIDTNFSSNDFK